MSQTKQSGFPSVLVKLFMAVVVVVVALWVALNIVIPLIGFVLGLVLPLGLLGLLGWFVYRILNYDPDKAA